MAYPPDPFTSVTYQHSLQKQSFIWKGNTYYNDSIQSFLEKLSHPTKLPILKSHIQTNKQTYKDKTGQDKTRQDKTISKPIRSTHKFSQSRQRTWKQVHLGIQDCLEYALVKNIVVLTITCRNNIQVNAHCIATYAVYHNGTTTTG